MASAAQHIVPAQRSSAGLRPVVRCLRDYEGPGMLFVPAVIVLAGWLAASTTPAAAARAARASILPGVRAPAYPVIAHSPFVSWWSWLWAVESFARPPDHVYFHSVYVCKI